MIARIAACTGVGIYSLKLVYDDGTETPLFGSRAETNQIEVVGDQIASVGLRAWKENYVQTISVKHLDQQTSKIESQSNNG